MGNITKSFSVENDILMLNGIRVGGYADGVYLSIEYDNPSANTVEGADGEIAVKFNNRKLATLTLTVLQTSNTNTILGALFNSIGRNSFFDVLFKDLSGVTTASGSGWFEKLPKADRALEPQNVEWKFKAALEILLGGN
jgi:hypothetical protein